MVSIAQLQSSLDAGQRLEAQRVEYQRVEYQCQANLNLYDSPAIDRLATQAVAGRQLRLLPLPPEQQGKIQGTALPVCLCEDDYPGWVALEDLDLLEVAETNYQAIELSADRIRDRLPQVIAFTQTAMTQANHYLWGGTVGPNYDCSGLIQTAFASVGIWIPRDAYQQEAWTESIDLPALQSGDLIFFGTPVKATHVGLYLGNGEYIHSSGREQGRNGIGIDRLSDDADGISQIYFRQLRGAGRVVACFQPENKSPELGD